MRRVILLLLLGMPALLHAESQAAGDGYIVPLETFDQYQLQAFPEQWKVRGDEDAARVIYHIAAENGNRFLHARADKHDVQIGLTRTFQPKAFPFLRWRWRVTQLPSGADERSTKTNDSAAAVYVIFDSTIIPRVIKYVWSSTLIVGTRISSPVYWRAKVVVLQSGPSRPDEWRQETVNFYQDYKDLFGTEPGEGLGIAVLTDADATKSIAEADYDDFTLLAIETSSHESSSRTAAHFAPATVGAQ